MSYLAIARKWRPTSFADLVGQSHVVQTLQNAIKLNRVSHAYLFSGARGVGKTSVARIFAKALRCPQAKEAAPCNQCEECTAISESRSVDVVEIDGASNNGVESVRGIRENVAYGASSGHYKIYIIDEVHMLSLSAFNALLKTLEEPPPHVLFLFATTEPQKIPVTILSRCQRFDFRRLNISQIADRLKYILDAEKVSLSEEALRILATHADGSLRDALSLLDQVLSFWGDKSQGNLGESEIVRALGISETSSVTGLLSAVVKKDTAKALQLVGEVYASGVDLKHFAERLLEEVRHLYLIVVSGNTNQALTADSLDLSSSHFSLLGELAKGVSLIQTERMAQIVAKAIEQLGWASLPRFVLEMAVVRMTKLDELSQWERFLKGNGSVEGESEIPAVIPTPTASARSTMPEPSRPRPAAAPMAPPPPETPYESASANPADRWKGFVDMVMKKRPLLGALLCHAGFELDGAQKKLTLAFPQGSFYERQAQDTQNRSTIEELVKNFFGKDMTLVLSTDTGTVSKSIEEAKQAEAAQLKQKALEHPNVVKAQEILGAELVDVNVEV